MIDDIIRMTQNLRKLMESNIPILETEIDSMIEKREESPKEIERLLDTLLDYLHMGIGEDQFLKLNSYYSSFCPENSAEYDRFYREIFNE